MLHFQTTTIFKEPFNSFPLKDLSPGVLQKYWYFWKWKFRLFFISCPLICSFSFDPCCSKWLYLLSSQIPSIPWLRGLSEAGGAGGGEWKRDKHRGLSTFLKGINYQDGADHGRNRSGPVGCHMSEFIKRMTLHSDLAFWWCYQVQSKQEKQFTQLL